MEVFNRLSRWSSSREKSITKKFLRFSLVGVSNTAIDWLLFFVLVNVSPFFGTREVLAKAFSFLVAVVNSFVLNSLWTFRDEVAKGQEDGVGFFAYSRVGKFFITALVGLGINSSVFSFVRVVSSPLPNLHSQLLSLALATGASLIWNFVINLAWTYQIGERKKPDKINKVAAGVIFLSLFIASFSALNDSVITDEVPHIAAGYSYIESGRMLLNLEHPPLGKYISALPLTALSLNPPALGDTAKEIDAQGAPFWFLQWEWGFRLIFGQGVSHELVVFLARLPMILMFGLAAWFVYLLGRDMFGSKAGLVSLALFSFSPNFLAHGRLVTTDVGVTFGFVVTLYFLYKYVKKGRKADLLLTGLFLGLANLFKFSALILYPVVGLVLLLKFFELSRFWDSLVKVVKSYVPIFFVGLFTTLLGYYFLFPNDVCCPNPGEVIFVGDYYSGLEKVSFLANSFGGRPILNYLGGIKSVIDRVRPGNASFIFGEISESSWWYFFPASFLFKEPIPTILGFFAALWFSVWVFLRSPNLRFKLLFLAVPFVVYFLSAVSSRFNLGIRHILSALPFLYVLIGASVSNLWDRVSWVPWAVGFAAVWLVLGTVLSFPNYIAYFNGMHRVLGWNKHEVFVDSNLQWGQNLIRLERFVREQNIEKIKVDAWFDNSPNPFYVPQALDWGSGLDSGVEWYAVGVTPFQLAKGAKDDPYEFLRDEEPIEIVGDGILVYHMQNNE